MKYFYILLLGVLAYGSKANAQTCRVSPQSLNVRNEAGLNHNILSTLSKGQKVQIISQSSGGWVKISSGHIKGYVLRKYLTCASPATKKKENMVLVCMGGSAYAYHRVRSCGGLKRCRASIVQIGESVAKNTYGRRPCKICY
jgi:uncharacterized protein YgiM (DUF1202 family)